MEELLKLFLLLQFVTRSFLEFAESSLQSAGINHFILFINIKPAESFENKQGNLNRQLTL